MVYATVAVTKYRCESATDLRLTNRHYEQRRRDTVDSPTQPARYKGTGLDGNRQVCADEYLLSEPSYLTTTTIYLRHCKTA